MAPGRLSCAALMSLVAVAPVLATPAPPPAVHWRQTLAGWGQPAVDAATAFVLTRHHEVAALDLATGAIRWRAYTGGPGDAPLGSSVRLAGAHVIVGDEAVVAFDRATGRPAWRFVPLQGRGAGVFLGEAGGGLVLAGSVSGDLYALDAATGRQRWTRRLTRSRTTAVYPPVIAAGRVVVAFTGFDRRLSGGLAAFDLHGRRLWIHRLPGGVGATGAVTIDGTTAILSATDGTVRAVSILDGTARWSLPPRRGSESPRAPARDIRALARSGRVLVAGSLDGELVAYDLDTRRQRWRYADGPDGAAALRLTADGTHVYAPYTDGSLVAVALATGREGWRTAPLPDPLEWPPAGHGRRLVAAGSNSVVALDTEATGTSPVLPVAADRVREER
jgi:outer membrane protein assembly factor BamB